MGNDKLTLKLAKFCKGNCPACKTARARGRGPLYQFVKFESALCPMCRSYKKVYGRPAYEK